MSVSSTITFKTAKTVTKRFPDQSAKTVSALDSFVNMTDAGYDQPVFFFTSLSDREAVKYKKIISGAVKVYVSTGSINNINSVRVSSCSESKTSFTYNTKPATLSAATITAGKDETKVEKTAELISEYSLRDILKNGMMLSVSSYNNDIWVYCTDIGGEYRPQVIAEFSDENVKFSFSDLSPADGAFVRADRARSFDWMFKKDGTSVDEITRTSAAIQWKIKGTENVSEIPISGQYSEYIPANTFPNGAIEWRVKFVSNAGDACLSEWAEFTTIEEAPSAECISPNNAAFKSGDEITYRWAHTSAIGTAQSKAELQFSYDNDVWEDLATVAGGNEFATIAHEFAAGTVYWRVRTFNQSGIPSEWATALTFTVIGKPKKPAITVENTPRPLIQWQAEQQQGWQLQIIGENGNVVVDVGTVYGTGKTYKLREILDDGVYVINLRVQSKFGYWSDWSSAACVVKNTGAGGIVLDRIAGNVTTLAWTDAGCDQYVIYRNRKPIGKTNGTSFEDWYANGENAYMVRGINTGVDDYDFSNEITINLDVERLTMICKDTETVIELAQSDVEYQTIDVSEAFNGVLMHIAGAKYPIMEKSDHYSKTISFTTALMDEDAKTALETMLGHIVCVKCRGGISVVGYLQTLKKSASLFYTAYNITVSQIDAPEVVEL